MERIYSILSGGFFVLGFIGAVASAEIRDISETPMVSLLEDVRVAEEANAINAGHWDMDVSDNHQDGLARVAQLLAQNKAAEELTNQ